MLTLSEENFLIIDVIVLSQSEISIVGQNSINTKRNYM